MNNFHKPNKCINTGTYFFWSKSQSTQNFDVHFLTHKYTNTTCLRNASVKGGGKKNRLFSSVHFGRHNYSSAIFIVLTAINVVSKLWYKYYSTYYLNLSKQGFLGRVGPESDTEKTFQQRGYRSLLGSQNYAPFKSRRWREEGRAALASLLNSLRDGSCSCSKYFCIHNCHLWSEL